MDRFGARSLGVTVAAALVAGVVIGVTALALVGDRGDSATGGSDFDPGPPSVDWVALSKDPAEDGDGSQLQTSYVPCVWYAWPDGLRSHRVYLSCGWDAIRYEKPNNPHEDGSQTQSPVASHHAVRRPT